MPCVKGNRYVVWGSSERRNNVLDRHVPRYARFAEMGQAARSAAAHLNRGSLRAESLIWTDMDIEEWREVLYAL